MRILYTAAAAILSSQLNVSFMTVPVSAQLLEVVRNEHQQLGPRRLRKGKRLSESTPYTPLRERDAHDDVSREHGRSLKEGDNDEMWVSPNFSMTTAAVETSTDSTVDTKAVADMLAPTIAIYEPTNGDGEIIEGKTLSHVGKAVYDVLQQNHQQHRRTMWNLSSGKVISLDATPKDVWDKESPDPPEGNDDWFATKMGDIIGRTEELCDILNLAPPDGRFLAAFQTALQTLAQRSMSRTKENPIVVRMLISPDNDVDQIMKTLTENLPDNANNLHIYVGAWLKGLPNMQLGSTWSHAKFIAADDILLSGGHNLMDQHHLSMNPMHDLSVHIEGDAAYDGHRFADHQWQLMADEQNTWVPAFFGFIPKTELTRISVTRWPRDQAPASVPQFSLQMELSINARQQHIGVEESSTDIVPVMTIGRQGGLYGDADPSEDAILEMFRSAKSSMRFTVQDFGPMKVPGVELGWPKHYLTVIGVAIYERNVKVDMVLSNPHAYPGNFADLGPVRQRIDVYGYGYTVSDVASELIKAMQEHYLDIDDAKLRAVIRENLRMCYIKHNKRTTYEDGNPIGLHSKHWIVDDRACYIGSQNLYESGNVADWGVMIDHEEEVLRIKNEYFVPMWRNSYTDEDVDLDKVMDALNVGGRDEDV